MRFNYIIGNPPYQDTSAQGTNKKLWKDITKRIEELYTEQICLITPDTQVQYLFKKYKHNTFFIDYTANSYLKVRVKAVAWGISKTPTPGKIINKDKSIDLTKDLNSWRDKSERDIYEHFEKLKKTPIQDRMFYRHFSTDEGEHESWVNYHNKKSARCTEKLPGKRLVISTSRSLNKENFIISNDQFGSLYGQLEITNMSRKQIDNVIDFMSHPIFKKYCDKFRIIYCTGFNNVVLYMPKIDINKTPQENLEAQGILKFF